MCPARKRFFEQALQDIVDQMRRGFVEFLWFARGATLASRNYLATAQCNSSLATELGNSTLLQHPAAAPCATLSHTLQPHAATAPWQQHSPVAPFTTLSMVQHPPSRSTLHEHSPHSPATPDTALQHHPATPRATFRHTRRWQTPTANSTLELLPAAHLSSPSPLQPTCCVTLLRSFAS